MLEVFQAMGTMPCAVGDCAWIDTRDEYPRSILLDISSWSEAVLIFKECRSCYTLEQDISGNSKGVGKVDGRFRLVEKLDMK